MGQSWDSFIESHSRLEAILEGIKSVLPPVNLITLHYAYFIVVSLVCSLIFWGSSNPDFSVSYVDSLFLVVSAITEAGLNTVNLSDITTWQQIILCLLMLFGGSILVSIWTVSARKHVFERRFKRIVQAERLRVDGPVTSSNNIPATAAATQQLFSRDASLGGSSPRLHSTIFSQPRPSTTLELSTSASFVHVTSSEPRPKHADISPTVELRKSGRYDWAVPPFLTNKTVGRNAQFHGLTTEEREHLYGCEYRALKLLGIVVPLYFVLWHLLGCLALGAWIANNLPGPAIADNVNPWWLGIFNGVSAFNNSGLSLLKANMVPFQNAPFVLITMGLMILAGNTAYPIFLRFILWSLLQLLNWLTTEETFAKWKETLEFILKYPRRVYTNLFPMRHTWWLLFMVLLLNCTGWVGFELLSLGNPVVESIPVRYRILDGLFQAVAVRSGGFSVVPISDLYIGIQILYVIMMYISVYPVVITMRHSNVYEERPLGIYSDDPRSLADQEAAFPHSPVLPLSRRSTLGSSGTRSHSTEAAQPSEIRQFLQTTFLPWYGVGALSGESSISFLSQQIHGQLAHDIWWLVLVVFLISTIETRNFLADPVTYSVFNVVFEVVSAYGCVGITTGVPNASYSFSGGWHSASKVILCFVMIRGRHRGLPVALDRAMRLPGDELSREE